jgi:hypothetical protein
MGKLYGDQHHHDGVPMAEPLQLPPPLEGDISLRTLGRLAGRLDNIDLEALMVYLVDIVDSRAAMAGRAVLAVRRWLGAGGSG